MKRYDTPEIEIINLTDSDIITTSSGTQTPTVDENDGIWDLNVG